MLVIDIETTHLSKNKGHIVEVGIVRLSLDNGEREIFWDSGVKEDGSRFSDVLSSWWYENSGVDPHDLVWARSFEKAMPEIQKIIDQDPDGVAAFNSAFDFGWLESRGLVFPRKLPDPMKICRPIVEAQDKNGRVKNPNVEEAWAYFFPDQEYKEKHRGADDALHEAAIIYELFKLGYYGKGQYCF